MADSLTPNVGALIADPADVIQYSAHVGNNYTLFDSLMGAVDCLSTARPSVTFKGQIIYERDSKRYAQNLASSAAPSWSYMSHSAMTATSSARPSSGLSTGLLAYETDSTGLVVWNGASWIHLSYKALASTSTTRPTGTSLFTGLTIWESDTSRLLIWNGASWEQLSFTNFVTTSSAHPASPFTGLEIFESDTGLSATYNGSAYNYTVGQVAATQTLGSSVASVTFTGIPSGIKHLKMKYRARADNALVAQPINIQFNGVTTSSYLNQRMEGNISGVTATLSLISNIQVGTMPAANATANYFGQGDIDINGWDDATNFTSVTSKSSALITSSNGYVGVYAGMDTNAGANTSIKIFPNAGNFIAGSRFSLYGWM